MSPDHKRTSLAGWVNRIAYASDTVLNFTNATVEQVK